MADTIKTTYLADSKSFHFTCYYKLCKSINASRFAVDSLWCFGYLLDFIFLTGIPYRIVWQLEEHGAGEQIPESDSVSVTYLSCYSDVLRKLRFSKIICKRGLIIHFLNSS